MNRRSMLCGGLMAAATLALPASVKAGVQPHLRMVGWPPNEGGTDRMFRRLGIIEDDPGVHWWRDNIDNGGGLLEVYLDGVDQYWIEAADEAEGWIIRTATEGNDPTSDAWLRFDSDGWIPELVHGHVRIVKIPAAA